MPVAAPAATRAAAALSHALATRADSGRGSGEGGPGWGGGFLLLLVIVPAGVVVGLVLLLSVLGGASKQACSPAGGGPLPGDFSGPGSLGGIGGTGISRPLLDKVRRGSPYAGPRVVPGRYSATAYGPPWGGIQGAGIATSGGLPIWGGAPRWYMIATSPSAIQHGNLVYVWPNPFGWKGPFLAADTGGAIVGHRIDFYDWRGRASQYRWGVRTVQVSTEPIVATGGDAPAPTPVSPVEQGPGSLDCGGPGGSLATPGAKGEIVLAPGVDRPGTPTRKPLLEFLAGVAGTAGRRLTITTGSDHSQYTSAGNVSDHWVGLAADFGSVANGFSINAQGGTRIAAAGLRTAGVPERRAWALANAGGGHDVCHRGWRVQVIWRTGDHYDHVHIGLRQGCAFAGVRTFPIRGA